MKDLVRLLNDKKTSVASFREALEQLKFELIEYQSNGWPSWIDESYGRGDIRVELFWCSSDCRTDISIYRDLKGKSIGERQKAMLASRKI